MQEILQQILVEVKETKNSVNQLEKKMNQRFKEFEIEMDKRFKEFEVKMDNKLNQRFKDFEIKVDERFKEFEVKVDKKFKEHTIAFDKKLDKQYSEISLDFKSLIEYLDEKFKKQDKVNQEILKELRENRLEHESYNSRLYKIEVAQSNLKNQFNELSKQYGLAI